MATLVVGPEKEHITVDKTLLCKGADFFGVAFNSGFKEGSTLVMKMPEEEPRLVKFVVKWLYAAPKYFEFPDKNPLPYEDILRLYLLAEKWILKDLQRRTFLHIDARTKRLTSAEHCRQLWDIVQESSVRFLVIQRYCLLLDDALEKELGPTMSENFRGASYKVQIFPAMNSLYQQTDDNAQFWRDVLLYHTVVAKLKRLSLSLPNCFESYLEAWKE